MHIFEKKNIKGKGILQFSFPHLTIKWRKAEGWNCCLMLKTEHKRLGKEAWGDPAVILTKLRMSLIIWEKQKSIVGFISCTCTGLAWVLYSCIPTISIYTLIKHKARRAMQKPWKDVGAVICPVVAGHKGDLCTCSFKTQVPHDVQCWRI